MKYEIINPFGEKKMIKKKEPKLETKNHLVKQHQENTP